MEQICFYDSLKDIGFSEPYATLNQKEMKDMINLFLEWNKIVESFPQVAEQLGDEKTVFIDFTNVLRKQVMESVQAGLFPNVILPKDIFGGIMIAHKLARKMESEIRGNPGVNSKFSNKGESEYDLNDEDPSWMEDATRASQELWEYSAILNMILV